MSHDTHTRAEQGHVRVSPTVSSSKEKQSLQN